MLDASRGRLARRRGVGPKIAEKISRARQDFDAAAELRLCRRWASRDRRGAIPTIRRRSRTSPTRRASCTSREPSSRATSSPSRWSARGTVRPTACGSPNGCRRLWPGPASRSSRAWPAASTRPRTAGAIKAGGRTIGVLANGLASVYPPEHEELARAVAEAGALVSEMPMRQGPLAGLFTQRNRIISGLSLGVLVVEATPRSGSLSTASHAMEQNREVFAVPGPADSLASRGCHRLIRDGARLVETVDDILEELGPLVQEVRTASRGAPRPPSGRAGTLRLGTIAPGPAGRSADRPSTI